MQMVLSILGGSLGAAAVSGIFALIQYRMKRRDARADAEGVERKALRYIMLYIIQERAREHILAGEISMDDRRSLHHWHELYHTGLGGNGDASALMAQVDGLPMKAE